MSAGPLFLVEGLRMSFQERLVLDLPRLEVADGQVTALMGHNGSGKTTLLKLLAGLLTPQAGGISYLGRPVGPGGWGLGELRRQVTMVHQDPHLFNGSVEDNITYGLGLRGLGRAPAQGLAREALERVGLAGFGRRRARMLSAGEGQRLALARALALRPRALLLDEPFASLDPRGSEICQEIVASLPAQGCAVLFITHLPGQARRLASQTLRLRAGRLEGPAEENLPPLDTV